MVLQLALSLASRLAQIGLDPNAAIVQRLRDIDGKDVWEGLDTASQFLISVIGDSAALELLQELLSAGKDGAITWQEADAIAAKVKESVPMPSLVINGRRVLRGPAWLLLLRAAARVLRQVLIAYGLFDALPAGQEEPEE